MSGTAERLALVWSDAVRLPLMARLWMRLELGIDPPDETLLDDALDPAPAPLPALHPVGPGPTMDRGSRP
jgi:hypothetical protein